ncbi:MAG: hypothetical protein BWY70_00767 [Bacteroidetes bacterium ADurb.Bin408]|nr:MAG: hypothetical protein BWY70_00767 [Bacteroidetes bacterium ADurb.Bin408]
MPNHFHLLVYVHTLEHPHQMTQDETNPKPAQSHQQSRTTTYFTDSNNGVVVSRTTTLNKSIGILLTSYTRAINIQENSSGSLFRPHTKAICLTQHQGITPSFFDTQSGTVLYQSLPEKEYPQVCFNYIHNNPLNAGMVNHPSEWPYSSYNEFTAKGGFKLSNIQKAKEFGLEV